MFALLEIALIYKALKLFADLQGPICYNVGWYPHKITESSQLRAAHYHRLGRSSEFG